MSSSKKEEEDGGAPQRKGAHERVKGYLSENDKLIKWPDNTASMCCIK
jgi:hypothetical protein